MSNVRFSARLVTGRGRGKEIGTPTLNIDLNDVPADTKEGIYAGWVKIDDQWLMGAFHYGPRPVFQDTKTFEVYVLDMEVLEAPERMEIVLVQHLRPVLNFPSTEELVAQINKDVAETRGILERHGPPQD